MARADVAQQHDPRSDDVSDRPERFHCLGPHRTVIAGIGLVERGKALLMCRPVEVAAVDDDAADRGAVPADVLGR